MALPATHLRFAEAVALRYAIVDRGAYFSGTLYPDSRWVTGLKREQTHSDRFLESDVVRDDFTAGWQVHLICDRLQQRLHRPLLGDIAALDPASRWIVSTASKVVQDMRDAALGRLADTLPLITHAAAPNGEDPAGVEAYLGYVRRAYGRHSTPGREDYVRLWNAVGLDRETIGRIAVQTDRILADPSWTDRIQAVFEQMVALSSAGDVR
jgi:hypothetical protein